MTQSEVVRSYLETHSRDASMLNAIDRMLALSVPLRSSCCCSPVRVSKMRMRVPCKHTRNIKNDKKEDEARQINLLRGCGQLGAVLQCECVQDSNEINQSS